MLYLIAALMIMLWVFGMVTAFTFGGIIHLLLIIAVVAVLVHAVLKRPR
ncbi:MAG TPA: lmo0937 family membrane protein [Paucimonas sp.]|nr:lmo0937 family membrane protein [Paucimonas sp.]